MQNHVIYIFTQTREILERPKKFFKKRDVSQKNNNEPQFAKQIHLLSRLLLQTEAHFKFFLVLKYI